MTIAAYQTLYQSSSTFAMRKQIQAEHGMADLDRKIEELEAEKKRQSERVIELKSKIEAIDTRCQEKREIERQHREK